MAAINLTGSVITPVAVGVVDEVLERMDDSAKRVDYARWSSIARLLAVVGGHTAALMGRGLIAEVGASLATSAPPLVIKNLANAVVKATGGPSPYFTPRRVAAGAQAREHLEPRRVYKIGA